MTPQNTLPTADNRLPATTGAQNFELLQRAAKALSLSTLVPKDYGNNIANCMIALRIADRIGADPLMVMQNLDIIHGRPTWRAQFLIGTANSCGRFSAIRYEFFGDRDKDSWGCRAYAIEKSTNEKLVGPDITIAISKAEGWYGKKDSKWKSIPQLMLMYRAGSWWVRAYAPELSLGFQTAEEAGDILDVTARTIEPGSDALKIAAAQLGAPKAEPEPAHDPETGEITDSEDETVPEPLRRAERLLKTCKTKAGVDDLLKSIGDELGDDYERGLLAQLGESRMKEL